MRLAVYGAASTLFATSAILSAFRQRSNFYSASVYLSKSNACMMILCNFGIFCTVILSKVLQSIFFGNLRSIEIGRLHDRLWFTVTETLLALAMFRDEFDTTFVVLFISLIFVKCFHWLASDRVEWMDQSPTPPGRLFHARMISVLSLIWITDLLLIAYATESILSEGASVILMFEMEYIIMSVTCLSIIAKYLINSYGQYRAQEHWEEKSTYVFYIELGTDFLKLLTYIGFLSLTLTFYGLPINVIRDVYYTARSFITKCNNLMRFRQATRNMNERYPNATQEEMDALIDKTCIICREDMEFRADAARPANEAQNAGAGGGPNDTPKKLPCGHVFHFHCLRSWLERQQTCPTCRRPVLQSQPIAPPVHAAAPQLPAAGAFGQPQVPPAQGGLPQPLGTGTGPRPGHLVSRQEAANRAREIQQRIQAMRPPMQQNQLAGSSGPLPPNPLLSFEIPNPPNTLPRRAVPPASEPPVVLPSTPQPSLPSQPSTYSTSSFGEYPYHMSAPTLGRKTPLTDYEKKKLADKSGAAEVARRQEILLNQPLQYHQQMQPRNESLPSAPISPVVNPLHEQQPSLVQSNSLSSAQVPRSTGYQYPYQSGPVPPESANTMRPSPPISPVDSLGDGDISSLPTEQADSQAPTNNTPRAATALGIPVSNPFSTSSLNLPNSFDPLLPRSTSSSTSTSTSEYKARKGLETKMLDQELPCLIPLFDTETYKVPESLKLGNLNQLISSEGLKIDPSSIVLPTRKFQLEENSDFVKDGLRDQLRLMIEIQEIMNGCSKRLKRALGEDEKDEGQNEKKGKGKEKETEEQ
ncbi:uncharacterized protein MELLADRAFT_93052 [Melampsora larici-populina 98AG31]|uniref:RING-type E3 ubiquitin transferase n=1 Tax=Melampsora larici-populina (strain 98AG31 / pathotype 3-4-7) TaxID=747676 RepID=F4S3R5_MELLP|nr:uncharacterized protein MELLADRAFT_93052 [Melampsora larici-populina 98AG31]EGG00751.1 hypothetical protein MELLADRAFT_93052 [Melampsora larici-populina 98AG31]